MILFLNKDDLFTVCVWDVTLITWRYLRMLSFSYLQKKASQVDLGIYFPAYTGGLDVNIARDFISVEFAMRNHRPSQVC